MHKVARSEWVWVVSVSGLILLAFSVPYLIGVLHSTSQAQFSGFLFGLEDMNSYLAKMRFGARDGWELQLIYTSEIHQGGLVYLPVLALGKLAAWITGQGAAVSAQALTVAYHIARLLCGLLLLVTIYRFVAEYVSEVWQRRLAWILASVGGGLGWILVFTNPSVKPLSGLPVEWYVPEGFSTLLIYGLPHLALARSLLLGGWLLLFASVESRDWRRSLLAGMAWLGMGLCVPFYIALLGILLAAWLTALWIVKRKIPWQEFMQSLIASVLPVIYLIYNLWLFTSNPIFAIWSSQNILPSPPITDYLLAFGLLIALAIPGAIGLIGSRPDYRQMLLVIWPAVAAVLVYLPINIQRRLLEGAIVPLTLLAVCGIVRLTELGRGSLRRFLIGVTCILLLPSTLLLLAGGVVTAGSEAWPVFHPADELAALRWLSQNAKADSVVLSTRDSGMILPAFSSVRVFLGHGPETVHAVEKERMVQEFLSSPQVSLETALIRDYPIDYVWIGPPERELPCHNSLCSTQQSVPGFRVVFSQGEYTIFQVER